MSNVPPPPGAPVPQKGLSTGVKVAIGCGIAVLLVGIVVVAALVFGAFKAKQYVEGFENEPVTSAARTYAAIHPDIEFVDADEDTEQVTFRNKDTGETVTIDAAELKEGRISFETAEGRTTFETSEGEDGSGSLKMTGPDGEATWRTGGASEKDVPAWVVRYPGAALSGAYSAQSNGKLTGAFVIATEDELEEVVGHFETELEEAGYTIETQSFSGGGNELRTLQGKNAAESREITVSITRGDEKKTQASVTYSGPTE